MRSPRQRALRTTLVVALSAAFSSSPSMLRAEPEAAPAAPADDPQARAAERKKAGDQAMELLRYEDALAAYGEAYAITKNPALLYNMGRALEALNRFPEALDKLTAFDAAAPPDLKARVPRLPTLIAELRQRVATLDIVTNVEGARIVVRNVVVGKSPLAAPLKLVAGPAEIEVDAEGYFGAKKTVTLEGGAAETVRFDLFSRATTGVLTVRASAPSAEVLVDGKPIGVAPVELNVPKGTHRITVRHRDFRAYETSAVVPAGGYKAVTATLEAKSVVTRWWFWTGLGAVVAAGAAVTVAAFTERAPHAGTIAPGQLTTEASSGGGATLFQF
ncbi:PEGA domain-containing protein [Polyangium sp. 15x6]|uniref:PEGA domain-containing protein n=1 Tax=Polyangium sp. 15x6 TaxID=3042687 RepID=UPI00249AD150|nr:PEGA domain-containing protein [Polyangium sp. 15x6]MDI3289174.1 PEGA domain-containing protein [Polyangium sp. 15x6]